MEKVICADFWKSGKIEMCDFSDFGLKIAFLAKIEKFLKIPKRRVKEQVQAKNQESASIIKA